MRGNTNNRVNTDALESLIPSYAHDKEQADKFKKSAEEFSSQIKQIMSESNEKTHTAGGYTVTRIVANRESMNTDRLLLVAKKYNLPIIKTVEVVDMDLLEEYLYNHELSGEQADDFAACKSTTEVVQLRVKKEK